MKPILVPANLTVLAYMHIKRHILEGSVDENERLTEESIANQLGISKSPVREALNRLEVEGLIRIEPRRGAYLKKFSIKDIADLYDYREALEAHVVLTAKVTPSLIEDMTKAVEQLRESQLSGQKDAYIQHDIDFHLLLASSTGNQRLIESLERLREQLRILRVTTYEQSIPHAVHGHARLIELLAAGDRLGAVSLMREHIRMTRDILIAHLLQPDAPKESRGKSPASA